MGLLFVLWQLLQLTLVCLDLVASCFKQTPNVLRALPTVPAAQLCAWETMQQHHPWTSHDQPLARHEQPCKTRYSKAASSHSSSGRCSVQYATPAAPEPPCFVISRRQHMAADGSSWVVIGVLVSKQIGTTHKGAPYSRHVACSQHCCLHVAAPCSLHRQANSSCGSMVAMYSTVESWFWPGCGAICQALPNHSYIALHCTAQHRAYNCCCSGPPSALLSSAMFSRAAGVPQGATPGPVVELDARAYNQNLALACCAMLRLLQVACVRPSWQ